MRYRIGLGMIATLGVLLTVGCSGDKDSVSPTPENYVTQGYDAPPSAQELQAEEGESWQIEQPIPEGFILHGITPEISLALPANIIDMSERLEASEGVQVFAKETSPEEESRPDVPVENLYIVSVPTATRFATILEEDSKTLKTPLDKLAYSIALDVKTAFPEATEFTSGKLKDSTGDTIGSYATFMSYGERLTRLEVLQGDNVLMISSNITGEVPAPDYLKTLTLT